MRMRMNEYGTSHCCTVVICLCLLQISRYKLYMSLVQAYLVVLVLIVVTTSNMVQSNMT